MRVVQAIVFVAALGCFSSQSRAFDQCDDYLATPKALREFLLAEGVYKAPVRFFDYARSIRIETGDGPRGLIPHGGHDTEGQPIIFYPVAFPPTLCRIALGTFMEMKGEWKPFAEASRDAGRCADLRRPLDICLVEYGRDLERRYRHSFEALDQGARDLAYTVYLDAAAQIATHEYAHHLLRHVQRIKSGDVARIDAEFEADFYAMLNAAQTGKDFAAMFLFFKALADVESYSQILQSPKYESGACRATNVDDIVPVFGIAPIVILDAVTGGRRRLRRNSPDLLRRTADKLRGEGPITPSAGSCGRLRGVVLREAHRELVRLTTLIAEYGDVLFAKDTNSAAGLALGTPKAYELIDRLQSVSGSFTHLKGLAAQLLSKLIQRVGFAGKSDAVARQLDKVLETWADEILSDDYGRLLNVKGLNILFHSPDRPLKTRMTDAARIFEKSVTFWPGASESWMGLAFIAFADGRCVDAAKFSDKSAHFASGERDRGKAEGFRDRMDEISAAGNCAKEAEGFAARFAR